MICVHYIYIYSIYIIFIKHYTLLVKTTTVYFILLNRQVVTYSNSIYIYIYMIMEKIQFNYSLKNIPIPSRRIYLQSLLDKLDSFIKRLRWKAFFFDTDNQNKKNNKPTYGFKTETTPLNARA